jgi:methionyl-tRNA formyltransferase
VKLVYFGSGAFGLPTLEHVWTRHEVAAVVTQPDRPAGRGGKLTPTPIAAWVSEHHPATPLEKVEKVNDPAVVERIRAHGADAWVVIAFGQKLGRSLLEGVFAVNLHASLLPRWRGAAPINAAILAGDTVTGNSVITLADRMDAGLILGQSRRAIDALMTAGELHDLLAGDGPALVERVLEQKAAGTLEPVVQDEGELTIASKLSKNDDAVDFHQRADFCRRQVHALTPWPGITVVAMAPGPPPTRPPEPFKLLRVQVVDGTHQVPIGTLLDLAGGRVACGHGTVLRVLEVQPAGKRAMAWADFARGRSLAAGSTLVSPREL